MTDCKLQVIGLIGPLGCGKTTVAKHLVDNHGFQRMSMANPLKRMLMALGLTENQVYGPQDVRSAPAPLLDGKSPRYAMQTIGTEWGREMISNDIWVKAVMKDIMDLTTKNCDLRIVIDDIRFPNEEKMVHELGGEVWRIRRPSVEPDTNFAARFKRAVRLEKPIHESERYWRTLEADEEFFNAVEDEGGLEGLLEVISFYYENHCSAGKRFK